MHVHVIDNETLLALQGPKAHEVLQPLVDFDLSKFAFMSNREATVAGIAGCTVTRCGYTGEDGFELSIPTPEVVAFAEKLLQNEHVEVKKKKSNDELIID